ncbi:LysM domain protein [Candidatus Desulfosporosinus infrequens]|uniref:LysM domain protein n=1 Tax=Candidatus Desulfosporosinus infrequens TaxID=2043169 RepID=A0A2U3K067_9FIRM|nr:LysM domain protein [Candidatus Desulfosporosinus infrequens]
MCTVGKEYSIQTGDNFHGLAQRWGGTCDDFLLVNPNVDPLKLQIGQKIVLPEFKGLLKGQEQYADISMDHGQEFVGDYHDDVQMEVEGVRIRLRRLGEPKIPHEIHFILPRTEIRKIQPAGEGGPSEVQVMLSNVNVVLSPRLVSDKGDTAEHTKPAGQTQIPAQQESQQHVQDGQTPQAQMQPYQFTASPQYGQGVQPALEQSQGFAQVSEQPRWRMTFPFNKR